MIKMQVVLCLGILWYQKAIGSEAINRSSGIQIMLCGIFIC